MSFLLSSPRPERWGMTRLTIEGGPGPGFSRLSFTPSLKPNGVTWATAADTINIGENVSYESGKIKTKL